MSKFCTKCGKELKDGQTCDCQKTTKATASSSTTTVDVKESCMDCVNAVKGVFTKPVETIKDFVTDNKFISGIIMIVAAAIASGIYKIATLKSIYGSSTGSGFNANDLSDLFSSAMSGNLGTKPDYLKEFFNAFINHLAEYAFIALLGYVVVAFLFKGKASWKQMLSAVGISLSFIILGFLVNSILVFVDAEVVGYIRGYVSSFAYISSILFLYKGVEGVAEVDKNKLFLAIASAFVAADAAMDIFNKIFK